MTGNLFEELKRRNVIRMAGLYLVAAWLLVQVASTLFPAFAVPAWALRALVIVLALGFVPAVIFAWAFELTPGGIKRDADVAPGESIAPQTARRMDRLIIAVLVLALGYFAFDRVVLAPRRDAALVAATTQSLEGKRSAARPAGAAGATTPQAVSIAVLPFVNMSADPEQEYFSDGLSEELLNLLAQLPQLRVIARTSSFSFKGKGTDVATIAKRLDVGHVLEGSVRKSGNTLRITAQLVRASDSSHLWSQSYDRELTDVFQVQDEIARAVVDALKVRLLPEQALTSSHRSANAEAYNLLLLGDQFLNRQAPGDVSRADAAYLDAIAHDPGYGMAYARRAAAQYYIADATDDQAAKQRALDVADAAVAKAPALADAYTARAVTRISFRRDWKGAEADLAQARKLGTTDAVAQWAYWRLLIALGREGEALAVAKAWVATDPVNANAWTSLGRSLNATGELPAARAALERALLISPSFNYANFQLGCNALYARQPQRALEVFSQMTPSGYRFAGVAMAQHDLGNSAASDAALRTLVDTYPSAAFQTAQAYGRRGEADRVFEWLDIALARNDGGVSFIKSDPILRTYKGDPRFAAFVRALGLPD